MKPNFALSLSFEGIRLLHRAAGGWRVVGDVSLDAEDLPGELAVLRKTAAALEPGGVRSKVIVPNGQIKYLTFDSEGLSAAALQDAARSALDGATPYAVDELVYDVSPDGTRSHIAAVARETLDEAEAFAEEHRFHPVSFAAIPGDNPYLGEPFFGQTRAADALLERDERVEPDGIAVVVIGDVAAPAGPVAANTGEDTALDRTDAAAPVETASEDDVSEDDRSADDVVKDGVAAADGATEPSVETAGAVMAADPRATQDPAASKKADAETPIATAAASQNTTARATDQTVSSAGTGTIAPPMPVPPTTKKPSPPSSPDRSLDGQVTTVEPKDAAIVTAPPPASSPVPPSARAMPTLRVQTTEPVTAKLAPLPGSVSADTVPESGDPAPLAGFASRRSVAKEHGGAALGGASRGGGAAGGVSVAAPGIAPATVTPPLPDSSSLTQSAPPSSRMGFLSRRKPATVKAVKQPEPTVATEPATSAFATAESTSEAERMTIFGARKSGEIRGKPRFLGLLLTAALLVFLAGVAAWASVFLDDGIRLSRLFGDREPRLTASDPAAPDPVAVVPQDDLPPPKMVQPPAPAPDEPRTASLDPQLTETDDAVLSALRDPILPPTDPLSDQQVAEGYAVTGIWPRAPEVPAPPAVITLEDLYLTSIDPVSTSNDAVALPKAESFESDVTLASLASPAAADINFTLDSRGLVVPTPEGAVTPDGILVFLGKPPAIPPGTPTRFIAEPEVDPARAELVGQRPRPRPGDLVETTERAQLDGLTRIELAGFRPALRPASVQQRAEEAAAAVLPAPVDTDAAVTAALATPTPAPAVENATKYAVQLSLRPDPRPGNFAGIVKRARRSAPEPEQVASAAATVAPRSVQPSIPSTASVARQATVKNAINLRDVNLIGVYGKPSNRRALVRLSNGRYQKVVVGDRMDGGRVSAIGDSELRYTKRGRDVVLRMPRN